MSDSGVMSPETVRRGIGGTSICSASIRAEASSMAIWVRSTFSPGLRARVMRASTSASAASLAAWASMIRFRASVRSSPSIL